MFSELRPKESHILDSDVLRFGPDALKLHFPSPPPDVRFIVDITPTYCGLSSPEIAAIAEQWPDAAIVAFVRDPVARAVSGVMRSRKFAYLGGQGETVPGTWQEALALNGPFSRLQNDYDINIARWRRHFPKQVHILNFDTIENSPAEALNGVFEFLEVQRTDEAANMDLGKKVNASSDVEVSIGADNELHLIDYWLSRELPDCVPSSVTQNWREKWLERRRSLAALANVARPRRVALGALEQTYRIGRQVRGLQRAKDMRRALHHGVKQPDL